MYRLTRRRVRPDRMKSKDICTTPSLPRRIIAQVRGHWKSLGTIFFLEMLSTPLSLLGPLGIKIAIDNVLGAKPLPRLLQIILPLSVQHAPNRLLIAAVAVQICVALVINAHSFCTYQFKIRSGEQIVLNFRSRVFRHLLGLPLSYHDSKGSADSAFRVQDDADALKSITIEGVLFLR